MGNKGVRRETKERGRRQRERGRKRKEKGEKESLERKVRKRGKEGGGRSTVTLAMERKWREGWQKGREGKGPCICIRRLSTPVS